MTPLEMIAEWRRGCSCAPTAKPEGCLECTRALIDALEPALAEYQAKIDALQAAVPELVEWAKGHIEDMRTDADPPAEEVPMIAAVETALALGPIGASPDPLLVLAADSRARMLALITEIRGRSPQLADRVHQVVFGRPFSAT